MAEVIAVGASVIAVIQISERIIGLCKFYIETARDAPSDFRAILIELSMLKTIFENLNFLTVCSNGVSSTVGTLSDEEGPIQGCLRSITELEKLFPQDCIKGGSKGQKVKSSFAALAWPLKENKARKLLDEIMRCKTTITLALTTESIQDIKGIKTKVVELREMLTESQRQDIYRWLQHTDPSPLHHRAQKQYEPGTGNWMLRCPEWTEWLDAKQRCLWVHGIPGAGKTVLMSYLHEQIKQHCQDRQQGKIACAYYYYYFSRNQDEAVPFLRWLLNKLCRQADSIPGHVYKMYKHGGEASLVELLKALAEILDKFDTAYIMVDAINESMPRDDILKVFRDLITDSRFEKIQLLASSREYIDIERVMEQFSVSVSMASPLVEEDIRLYIRSIVQSNSRFKRWPRELLDEVEVTVSTGAKGMFRWAVCQIDALQRLNCRREIVRKALANLPKSLEETYDRVFLAIPEEERTFVHHVLQRILYHNDLHRGKGIPRAILLRAVEKSMAGMNNDQAERFYDNDTLRELCGCLVSVTLEDAITSKGEKYSTLTASFAHYAVREYIDSVRISKASATYFDAYPENLKQNCLGSVLLEALHVQQNDFWEWRGVSDRSTEVATAIHEDFNTYCVVAGLLSLREWPREISQDSHLCNMALDLLNPSRPNFVLLSAASWQIEHSLGSFLERDWPLDGHFWEVMWDTSPGNTDAVHLLNLIFLSDNASECSSLAQKFLEGKGTKDFLQSPLHFESFTLSLGDDHYDKYRFDGSIIEVFAQFAGNGIEQFILLLDYGKDFFDPSKVLCLYIGDHDHGIDCKRYCVVERLLECGADPGTAEYQFTPLQIAVVSWDLEGISILLKAGADPNYTGNSNGIVWEEGTLMSRFNHLRNTSPLYICRNFDCIMKTEYLKDERKQNVNMIEAALLEYGAIEILSK